MTSLVVVKSLPVAIQDAENVLCLSFLLLLTNLLRVMFHTKAMFTLGLDYDGMITQLSLEWVHIN